MNVLFLLAVLLPVYVAASRVSAVVVRCVFCWFISCGRLLAVFVVGCVFCWYVLRVCVLFCVC